MQTFSIRDGKFEMSQKNFTRLFAKKKQKKNSQIIRLFKKSLDMEGMDNIVKNVFFASLLMLYSSYSKNTYNFFLSLTFLLL